jgi:hypothetical protein
VKYARLAKGEDAEIGEGEAGGEPGARDVERAESGAPREERSQRIVGSGEPQDARLVQKGGEAVARCRRVTAGLREPGHEVRLRLSGISWSHCAVSGRKS